jgi:hypothetical protein
MIQERKLMTDHRNKMLLATPVILAMLAGMPITGFTEQELEFTYSDEWSVVSAPPPSGPYQAVHIDPRVPGQGITPPVTSVFEVDDSVTPSPDVLPGKHESTAVTTSDTTPPVTEGIEVREPAVTGIATAVPADEGSSEVEPASSGAGVAASAPEIDGSGKATTSVTSADKQPGMATGTQEPAPESGVIAVENELPASDDLLRSKATAAQGSSMEVPVPSAPVTSADKADAMETPAAVVSPVDMAKPAPVVEAPVRENKLAAPKMPPAVPGYYAPGLPTVAEREAVMPAERPPMPGVYNDVMPPPAAGAPGAATMPPATGRPGATESYGRMMPRPPAYNYPGRNWQPGWGMPGYGNMPPYGYRRGPADAMEGEVPPPGRYVPPPNYGSPYPGR